MTEFNSLFLCVTVVSHLLLLYYLLSLLSLLFLISLLACSVSPSTSLPLNTGTHSQSAAIQLKEPQGGKSQRAEEHLRSHPGTLTPPNLTPVLPAHEEPMDHELQRGQLNSEPNPGPNKRAMGDLGTEEIVKVETSIRKINGQDSAGGASSSYRPIRRGFPRPSTHNHFDINEHLPWMIVLLLLLVLVVIVVCSVKQSSQVLKKGPMQDPSSIMEKAIQKKPPAPLTQAREKWIYYSNGQGKPTGSFGVGNCFSTEVETVRSSEESLRL